MVGKDDPFVVDVSIFEHEPLLQPEYKQQDQRRGQHVPQNHEPEYWRLDSNFAKNLIKQLTLCIFSPRCLFCPAKRDMLAIYQATISDNLGQQKKVSV